MSTGRDFSAKVCPMAFSKCHRPRKNNKIAPVGAQNAFHRARFSGMKRVLVSARLPAGGEGFSALAALVRGACSRLHFAEDAENRALLLKNMAGVQSRGAHFACAVALVFPGGRELTAEGASFGEILHEERGTGGFGYDSLFYSADLKKSFAEATEEEKNAVSHRGRALAALEKLC